MWAKEESGLGCQALMSFQNVWLADVETQIASVYTQFRFSESVSHCRDEQLDPEVRFCRKMDILCLQYMKYPPCSTAEKCWLCVS